MSDGMLNELNAKVAERLGLPYSDSAFISFVEKGGHQLTFNEIVDKDPFDPCEPYYKWVCLDVMYVDEEAEEEVSVNIGNICACVHYVAPLACDYDALDLYDSISNDQLHAAFRIQECGTVKLDDLFCTAYLESIDMLDSFKDIGLEEAIAKNMHNIIGRFSLLTPDMVFGIAVGEERNWAYRVAKETFITEHDYIWYM